MARPDERCASCGELLAGSDHRRCAFDPPRFCTRCGRRLRVQIFPLEVRSACPACDRPGRPDGKLGPVEVPEAGWGGAGRPIVDQRVGYVSQVDAQGSRM